MTVSRTLHGCPPYAHSPRKGGTTTAQGTGLSRQYADSSERGDNGGHPQTQGCMAVVSRGWQSALAVRLNVDRRKVNDVLLGKRTSARIAAAIAVATGQSVAQLWPGRYKRLEFLERVGHLPAKGQP